MKSPPTYLYMEHRDEAEDSDRRFSVGKYVGGEWEPESYHATKGAARGRCIQMNRANPLPRIVHHDIRSW